MKIYRPIKTNRKTQSFGESKACAQKDMHGQLAYPIVVKGKKGGLCPFGFDDFYKMINMLGHNGEDWATWHGEYLYFPVDAVGKNGLQMKWWSRSEVDDAGGVGLDIFSADRFHLKELPPQAGRLATREWNENKGWVYVKFRFWHLKDILVPDATRPIPEDPRPTPNVVLGQLIATCDNTGASSGDHLHWSMKIVAENSMTLDNDNGYTGAVDFSRWFQNDFVVDVLANLQAQVTTLQDEVNKLIFNIRRFLGLI